MCFFADTVIKKKETIGEVLNGDRLTNTLYELNFREEKHRTTLCPKKLKAADVAKFRDAVINDFYFQMFYDDLPLWAFVGKVEDESWNTGEKRPKYYLFKHVQFDAVYNDNQVIEIKAFSDPNNVVDITGDAEIDVEFTYTVNWNATSAKFESRMDKYSKASLLPIRQKMHWFSLIESIVIIVLLMGFLALLIMRRLKNDLRRYCIESYKQAFNQLAMYFFNKLILFKSRIGSLILMEKKIRRSVGNTSMVMYSDALRTCPYLVPFWVLVPSYSPCKNLEKLTSIYFMLHVYSCSMSEVSKVGNILRQWPLISIIVQLAHDTLSAC